MAKIVRSTPVQPIRMYLLKKSVIKYNDALRDNKLECDEFPLRPELGFSGRLLIRRPQKSIAKWGHFLQQGVAAKLPDLRSTPHAAVLFLEVDGRTFALVFGMGRYMLRDTSYEAEFGIRSALNAVDPKGIRSADTFQFEAVAVHKRTQASRDTSLGDLEIDPTREQFRSVTGRARTRQLAEKITGNEGGLGTNVRLKFADLPSHCSAVLATYRAKTYQAAFPRFENLQRMIDKAKIEALEEKLVERLKNRNTTGIYLSPPEPIDYDDFSGFSLSPKGEVVTEMAVEAYLTHCRDLGNLDVETLKRHRVFLRKETVDEPLARWSVFKSLICEFPEGRNVFVLIGGEWFKVARTFAGQVHDFVNSIPEVDVGLPPVVAARTEPDYLAEVQTAGNGLIVLDRKLAYCEEAGHSIEVCDVLTPNRDFVHVKRKDGGSADLSHLFNQGRCSALALIRDEQFRSEARGYLEEFGNAAVRRVPKTRPTMGSFRVVYAIMGRYTGRVSESLPFFSKMCLMSAVQQLAERGVEAVLCKIESL